MGKYLMIGLMILTAVGCSTKGRGSAKTMEPVKNPGEQSAAITQDSRGSADDIDMTDAARINGLAPVFFQFDRYDITDDQLPVLNANSRFISDRSLHRVRIEGHCDERGTEEYNLALGDRRATATKDYLVSLGIEPDVIETISFGENRPFEIAHHEAAWKSNRRAQFVVPK